MTVKLRAAVYSVDLVDTSYPVWVGKGCRKTLQDFLKKLPNISSVVVLSSQKIASFHLHEVRDAVGGAGIPLHVLLIPDGERFKTLLTVRTLAEKLMGLKCDRNTVLINLGGGVVGDLGGFLAGVFKRGIRYIQLPTTLLAQVDAAIGGKTGVNLDSAKNSLGLFYQPKAVFCDIGFLQTLSPEELKNGLAEVVKYGMIEDKSFFNSLKRHAEAIVARDEKELFRIVRKSVESKAKVVSIDEREDGQRVLLNFGHTLGHGIEAATEYDRFKHGQCVAVGMVGATLIARKLKLCRPSVLTRLEELLDALSLPRALNDIGLTEVMEAITHDKKRKDGKIRMVLPTAIGQVTVVDDVSPQLVYEALGQVVLNFDW